MVSKIRILVVDDEPSISESMVEFLTDYGYDVKSAASGEEALEIIAHSLFHFAIVDMRLPDMNGEALILKAHKILPSLQYLIHTGTSEYRLSDELKKIGINSRQIYLKPIIDLTVLIKGIEDLVQERDDDRE